MTESPTMSLRWRPMQLLNSIPRTQPFIGLRSDKCLDLSVVSVTSGLRTFEEVMHRLTSNPIRNAQPKMGRKEPVKSPRDLGQTGRCSEQVHQKLRVHCESIVNSNPS